MLNSAEVTKLDCVSAILKGEMVSQSDLQRFYPQKFVMLSIMFMDADESVQMENVDDSFFQKTALVSDWDDSYYTFELKGLLQPATTYLYKIRLQVDSIFFTGRVKSFTTDSVDKYLWMDVVERNFTSVKLAGKGYVENMIGKNSIYVNFDEEWPPHFVNATQTGDSLTATIEGLWPGRTYPYWVTASGIHGTLDTSKRTFTTASPADYIYIDCPPSLELLTLNALCASDGILIPVQCEYFALEGLSDLISTMRAVKKRLNPGIGIEGVLLTMFDGRTNFSYQVAAEVKRYFKDLVYRVVIPRNIRLSEAPSHGKPVLVYDRSSKGAEAYRQLAEEIVARERR